MKKKILFTIVMMLVVQIVSAYPISPRTLRKLITESELIVWARVKEIKTLDSESWYDAIAILEVKEVLQGSEHKSLIEVYFSPNTICPAPAHYEEGSQVLAFLDKRQRHYAYETHALSYGAKTLNEEDYQVYKQRIVEMQAIQKMDEGEARNVLTLDWIVDCAVHPATRWEGTYELSAFSDFMSFYDEDTETVLKQYELAEYHKEALEKALFAIDTIGIDDMGIVDLVAREEPEEVLTFLQEQLKAADLEKMWYSKSIMERIVELSGRDDLEKILLKFKQLSYLDEDFESKNLEISREFVEVL